MSNNVIADVSQYSRESGRQAITKQIDKMHAERQLLLNEKRTLEVKLSDIEAWRREETAKILRKRLDKTRSIEATTTLEGEARQKKAAIIREKETIEQRLFAIKTRLSESHSRREREPDMHSQSLDRIESLLERLCKRFGA